MTVPTQPVTVRLSDFGGPAIEGAVVKARLTDIDYTVDGMFVSTEVVTATTDSTGTAILNVFPNAQAPDGLGTLGTRVLFTASIPRSRDLRVYAVVPNEPCNLVDILVDQEDIEGIIYVPPVQVADYAALRAYAGNRNAVYVTGNLALSTPDGISGLFLLQEGDTTSADNGGTILVGAGGKRWKRVFSGAVDVRWFGAKGDGVTDDTNAYTNALAAHDVVYAPASAVSYRVSNITLNSNKTLETDGLDTVFHQLAGQVHATHIFDIKGSYVTLESCTVKGNIATDSDEQMHAVFVRGAVDIRTIRIGDIYGQDLRGDVVYVGGLNTAGVFDVKIGTVYIDNVLRNGVSITGGCDIYTKAAVCKPGGCGYAIYDVEPNSNSQYCDNIHLEYGYGWHVANGGLPGTPIGNTTYGFLDLDPAFQPNSTTPYALYTGLQYGCFIPRNFETIKIRHLRTRNTDTLGIWNPSNVGDYVSDLLQVDYLEQENCSLNDPTYDTYNLISHEYVRKVVINGGKVNLAAVVNSAFQGCRLTVRDFWCNGKVAVDCPKPLLERVKVESTYDAYVTTGTGRTYSPTFLHCQIAFTGAVGRLTNTVDSTLIDSDVTVGVFVVPSSTNIHVVNSTINGVFYSFGQYLREYSAAMREGSFYTWRDSNGKRRYAGSAPATDNDGYLDGRVGQVSADKGDAAATLSVKGDSTSLWATPLTADRAVTLSTTSAQNGSMLRIVRAATATGAFKLNVGVGPLIALDAGQWCDVEYDGAAWRVHGFGSTAQERVADYAALRAYTGGASRLDVSGYLASAAPSGVAGTFVRDDADTTSADNGGTIIVASNGKRWKRVFDGAIHAKWFGATGDGSADDTTPLNNACVAAYGRHLYIDKPRVEYLTGRLIINGAAANNTTIEFEAGTILRKKVDGLTVLLVQNCENVVIHGNGVWMYGDSLPGEVTSSHTVMFSGAKKCVMNDVNIYGAGSTGGGKDNIYLGLGTSVCEDITIRGGKCLYGKRNGISVVAAKRTLIDGVEMAYATGAPGAGIDVETNDYTNHAYDTEIRNCWIHDNEDYGVLTSFCDRVWVHHNVIHDNGQHGIANAITGPMFDTATMRSNIDVRAVSAFDTATGRVTVSGDLAKLAVGTVVQFSVSNGAAVPVTLQAQPRWIVDEISSATQIRLAEYLDYNRKTSLSDAGVAGSGAGMTTDPATSNIQLRCYEEGQSSNVIIEDNYIYGNTNFDVNLSFMVNVKFARNLVRHDGGGGASCCAFFQIRNLTVEDNDAALTGVDGGYGFFFDGCVGLSTARNEARNFLNSGIYAIGCSRAVMRDDRCINTGVTDSRIVQITKAANMLIEGMRVHNQDNSTIAQGIWSDATLTNSKFASCVAKGAGTSNSNSLVIGSNRVVDCIQRDGSFFTGGGQVVQATSKATAVTLNTRCGQITLFNDSLAAGAIVTFTLNNSFIGANDIVHPQRKSGGTAGAYRTWTDSTAAGSCVIAVQNVSGGALAESPIIQFDVRPSGVA